MNLQHSTQPNPTTFQNYHQSSGIISDLAIVDARHAGGIGRTRYTNLEMDMFLR